MRFVTDHHPHVFQYLPEVEIELPKTPKQWVSNVITSVVGEPFTKWVKKQVQARHAKVAVQNDLMIQMDPEIAKVFQQSTAVSSKCLIFNPSSPILFFCSEQGHFRQPPPGWLQAAPHQGVDRSRQAGEALRGAAGRIQAGRL